MLTEEFTITEESFRDFCKDASNASVVMIYSIAKHHEKYRLTKWAMDELVERGFRPEHLTHFDEQFTHFYQCILDYDNL